MSTTARAASFVRGFDARTLWAHPGWRFEPGAEILEELTRHQRAQVIDERFVSAYHRGDLPWPALAPFAAKVRDELLTGSGVAWIQGRALADFPEPARKLFYLAFGLAMGDVMETYGRLYDVKDTGASYRDTAIPVSQTSAETTFHTDSSARDILPDLVGLLCLYPARLGGESRLSSAVRAYEEIRSSRSDHLAILSREHIRDLVTPGTSKEPAQLLSNRFPIFSIDPETGELTFRYMRYWIEKGQARANLPLTEEHCEALDHLDERLSAKENVVSFRMEAGDILWVNNRTIAHNRTAFQDEPERPRRMTRAWIKLSKRRG